jgi:beta-glucosidase
VKGILEAWYPGIGGAQALANILFGEVNPSAKLPVTFAMKDDDLPHPDIQGSQFLPKPGAVLARGAKRGMQPFDVNYNEGLKVGYKWFEAERKEPLFAFGYGLSYTTYQYSDLKVDGKDGSVSFRVKNTGQRGGAETAQVYAMLPAAAGEPFKRLVAWEKVTLAPGESKAVSLKLEPHYLSIFNAEKDAWELTPGEYTVLVGPSSKETPLQARSTYTAVP